MIGRRVAITGLGVVAPCGIGQESFWAGLLGPGITSGKWVTIPEWDPLPWFDGNAKEARRADRVEQFAIAAAAEAMAQAGDIGVDPTRFESSLAPVSAASALSKNRFRSASRKVNVEFRLS